MLKNWTPGEIPTKDEINERLEKARTRLYELQMKIKELKRKRKNHSCHQSI